MGQDEPPPRGSGSETSSLPRGWAQIGRVAKLGPRFMLWRPCRLLGGSGTRDLPSLPRAVVSPRTIEVSFFQFGGNHRLEVYLSGDKPGGLP